MVTRNGQKGFLDDKGNFYPVAGMPSDNAGVAPSSSADQSGGLGRPDVRTTKPDSSKQPPKYPNEPLPDGIRLGTPDGKVGYDDPKDSEKPIPRGLGLGAQRGEPVIGSDQKEPEVKSTPKPSIPKNKDGTVATQITKNTAGLTPMQQWAKNFPKLAAKVKPGKAGYDDIQKVLSPNSTINPTKAVTGGVNPRAGSYAAYQQSVLKNLSSDYGRLPQGTIKPAALRGTKKEAYDVVLDYLLSEGHVDTVEEAHYVMLQMTPEHVRDIIGG